MNLLDKKGLARTLQGIGRRLGGLRYSLSNQVCTLADETDQAVDDVIWSESEGIFRGHRSEIKTQGDMMSVTDYAYRRWPGYEGWTDSSTGRPWPGKLYVCTDMRLSVETGRRISHTCVWDDVARRMVRLADGDVVDSLVATCAVLSDRSALYFAGEMTTMAQAPTEELGDSYEVYYNGETFVAVNGTKDVAGNVYMWTEFPERERYVDADGMPLCGVMYVNPDGILFLYSGNSGRLEMAVTEDMVRHAVGFAAEAVFDGFVSSGTDAGNAPSSFNVTEINFHVGKGAFCVKRTSSLHYKAWNGSEAYNDPLTGKPYVGKVYHDANGDRWVWNSRSETLDRIATWEDMTPRRFGNVVPSSFAVSKVESDADVDVSTVVYLVQARCFAVLQSAGGYTSRFAGWRQYNVEMDGEDRAIPGKMFVGPESMYCADYQGILYRLYNEFAAGGTSQQGLDDGDAESV